MSNGTNGMTPTQLFGKTLPFVWAKLLLRLAAIGIGVLIVAICIGINNLSESGAMRLVLIGTFAAVIIYNVSVRVVGYAIRVGHVAVLAEALKTGVVPENQVRYGKDAVVRRFPTAAVFFALDILVEKSIKQLQKALSGVLSIFGAIPVLNIIVNLLQAFLDLALRNVDECVLGWIFYTEEKDESAFKGAVDGIVIYFQNWKKVLGNALKSTIIILVLTLLFTVVIGLIVFGILRVFPVMNELGFLAFIFALMMAVAVKNAFFDSYVMVQMICAYMEVAPSTEIKFDLYTKLCGLSSKFRELFNQAPQGEMR
jgi:hypothetical protein